MTATAAGSKPTPVTTYRNPNGTHYLSVGSEYAVLSEDEAEKIGRHLLFKTEEDSSLKA